MLPLLATLIPSIVSVVGSLVRGKSKPVDMALDAVQAIIKTPINSSKDIEKALEKATPEQLVQLREADAKFKIEFNRVILGLATTEVADRQHAREQSTKSNSRMPGILTLLITVGYFCLIFMMFFWPVPVAVHTMFGQLVDSLRDSLMLVVGFWFGSSLGSRSKDMMR